MTDARPSRRRRLWHRLVGHPAGARWEGELTAGCLDCGHVRSRTGEPDDL